MDYCALPVGACLIDIGCGAGASVAYAAQRGLAAVGVDHSAVLLRRAYHRQPGLMLLHASAEHLPLADGNADAVLAECSLSLVGNRDRAFAELERVLKPGGLLIASDLYARNPQALAALRSLLPGSCLAGALSQQQTVELLQAHQFCVEIWQDHPEALRAMAAQATLLWGDTDGVDPFDAQLAVARVKPGYYLLVARKGEQCDGRSGAYARTEGAGLLL